ASTSAPTIRSGAVPTLHERVNASDGSRASGWRKGCSIQSTGSGCALASPASEMRALTAPPLWRTLGSRALPIGAVCLSGLIIGLLPARFAAAVIAGVVLVVVALRDVRAALVLTA